MNEYKYKLVSEYAISHFNAIVQELAESGYTPTGELVVTATQVNNLKTQYPEYEHLYTQLWERANE